MNLNFRAFLRKHVAARSRPRDMAESAIEELGRKTATDRRAPVHIPDQRDLIADLFAEAGPAWLVFFDGGRYDFFDQLVGEYFSGELRRAYNGGVGYTGDWYARNLAGNYEGRGMFSWAPIHGFVDADYDEREHFDVVPNVRADRAVNDQLAALGYREAHEATQPIHDEPRQVNRSVGGHLGEVNGGVVRYVKPHPPLTGLEDMTTGAGKTQKVRQAVERGELTYAELVDAYEATFREGLEAAAKLVPQLPGRVVLSADHGTCLTCGQLFHARTHEQHDHLCVVPWFEVDGT